MGRGSGGEKTQSRRIQHSRPVVLRRGVEKTKSWATGKHISDQEVNENRVVPKEEGLKTPYEHIPDSSEGRGGRSGNYRVGQQRTTTGTRKKEEANCEIGSQGILQLRLG